MLAFTPFVQVATYATRHFATFGLAPAAAPILLMLVTKPTKCSTDSKRRTDAGQHFGHQTCEHFHLVCASRHFSSGAWGCGPPNPSRGVGRLTPQHAHPCGGLASPRLGPVGLAALAAGILGDIATFTTFAEMNIVLVSSVSWL